MWWSKASPDGRGRLTLVNAYLSYRGSFEKGELFPPVDRVYSDLRGRRFAHPVMNKPPWNFVTYGNPSRNYIS